MYKLMTVGNCDRYEARYWNPQSANITVVASVTNSPDGTPFDWAAYIGADPTAYREEEAIDWALEKGAKLSEEDARYFFPMFKEVPYRH